MLPKPTDDLVKEMCEEFDRDSWTKIGEESLRQLREQFPRNTETSHVLIKTLVLNKLYSTRIDDVDVLPLARHIAGLGIDLLLDEGSLDAVRLIYECPELKKMYYSFATKFCSWHNPTAYPIYDHYVDVCLWSYKQQDGFADFHRQDLGYYDKLVPVLSAFCKHYDLKSLSHRDLDKFLWLSGYRILSATVPQSVESAPAP